LKHAKLSKIDIRCHEQQMSLTPTYSFCGCECRDCQVYLIGKSRESGQQRAEKPYPDFTLSFHPPSGRIYEKK